MASTLRLLTEADVAGPPSWKKTCRSVVTGRPLPSSIRAGASPTMAESGKCGEGGPPCARGAARRSRFQSMSSKGEGGDLSTTQPVGDEQKQDGVVHAGRQPGPDDHNTGEYPVDGVPQEIERGTFEEPVDLRPADNRSGRSLSNPSRWA